MKRIFFVIALLGVLASCNDAELEKRQATIDSLKSVTQDNDGTINDLFESFNSIEENLELIKEKENIIRLNSSSESGVEEDMKTRINEDINSIYDLMLKNKQELKSVQNKMRRSGIKVQELDKMVSSLSKQMESKGNEIDRLSEKLKQMDIEVGELKTEVVDLNENIDSLSNENTIKEDIIEGQIEALNTAYYSVGTKKELVNHQVLTKEGLLGTKTKLLSDFNKDYFTTVNITELSNIPIYAKKITIITTHPSSSYELTGGDNVDELIIKDAAQFWSVSKYLVIQTK